jgi:hypothetical protein
MLRPGDITYILADDPSAVLRAVARARQTMVDEGASTLTP